MSNKPVYHWSVEDGFVTLADERILSWEQSREFLLEQSNVGPTSYAHKSELAYGLASHLKVLMAEVRE